MGTSLTPCPDFRHHLSVAVDGLLAHEHASMSPQDHAQCQPNIDQWPYYLAPHLFCRQFHLTENQALAKQCSIDVLTALCNLGKATSAPLPQAAQGTPSTFQLIAVPPALPSPRLPYVITTPGITCVSAAQPLSKRPLTPEGHLHNLRGEASEIAKTIYGSEGLAFQGGLAG
jgi:hypothetical protein